MPVIRLPDATYERLQKHATPFTDTPATVIDRLLDHYEGEDAARSSGGESDSGVIKLNPEAPDDLRFTRLISVQIADLSSTKRSIEIRKPNWNKLLQTIHELALDHVDFDELKRVSTTNIRQGRFDDRGFHYLAESDISVQNKPANDVWKDCLRLAQHLDMKLRIELEWRNRDKAAHPGERAVLQWPQQDNTDGAARFVGRSS